MKNVGTGFLMKIIITYIKKMCVCMIISMLAASAAMIGCVVVSIISAKHIDIIYTSKFNLIISTSIDFLPLALLSGLLISPSILIYYVLDFFHKSQKTKTIGYIVPILGWVIYLIICIILDAQRQSSEGAGQLATLILINDFIAGAVVYILMSKIKWLK